MREQAFCLVMNVSVQAASLNQQEGLFNVDQYR
jgi:hypothetical protein